MRKVLISFLGAPRDEYRSATYKIGDKEYQATFVGAALAEHYNIENIIMVGTTKSMWDEAFRWGYERKNGCKIENDEKAKSLHDKIKKSCKEADHETELKLQYQEEMETAMGNFKIVLIKYGITEEEIRENTRIILGLQEYLEEDDSLIIDISHSFRSLPMFIMNLLIYLKDVCTKKIEISHIHYGMLEVSSELKYAPIVDLTEMMTTLDWITGVYAFRNFGNTDKIAELLKRKAEEENAAKTLENLSEVMELNYLPSTEHIIQRNYEGCIKSIEHKNDYHSYLAQIFVPTITKEFIETFDIKAEEKCPVALLQLKLAEWQFKHKKYGLAYLNATEAIVSYIIEMCGLSKNVSNYFIREAAKASLHLNNRDKEKEKEYIAKKLEKIKNEVNKEDKEIIEGIHKFSEINLDNNSKITYRHLRDCRNLIAHGCQHRMGDVDHHMFIRWLGCNLKKLKEIIVNNNESTTNDDNIC